MDEERQRSYCHLTTQPISDPALSNITAEEYHAVTDDDDLVWQDREHHFVQQQRRRRNAFSIWHTQEAPSNRHLSARLIAGISASPVDGAVMNETESMSVVQLYEMRRERLVNWLGLFPTDRSVTIPEHLSSGDSSLNFSNHNATSASMQYLIIDNTASSTAADDGDLSSTTFQPWPSTAFQPWSSTRFQPWFSTTCQPWTEQEMDDELRRLADASRELLVDDDKASSTVVGPTSVTESKTK